MNKWSSDPQFDITKIHSKPTIKDCHCRSNNFPNLFLPFPGLSSFIFHATHCNYLSHADAWVARFDTGTGAGVETSDARGRQPPAVFLMGKTNPIWFQISSDADSRSPMFQTDDIFLGSESCDVRSSHQFWWQVHWCRNCQMEASCGKPSQLLLSVNFIVLSAAQTSTTLLWIKSPPPSRSLALYLSLFLSQWSVGIIVRGQLHTRQLLDLDQS